MMLCRPLRTNVFRFIMRTTCVNASTTQSIDPIQQAFVTKLREYKQKSKSNEMGLADATAAETKELNEMLAKIDRIFGASGQDMTQFPSFKFSDPQLFYPSSSLNVDLPKESEVIDEKEKPVSDENVLVI